jgi:ribosomal protein S27E
MKKVKCQCLSCNHIQFVEEGMTVSCDGCGVDINSNEDKYED